ncbi:MAG: DoxX family protein [Bdellovibrionota bacterium]
MLKVSFKYLFSLLFIAAGINHFLNPAFYLSIMPPYLPWHAPLVYLSGVAEILLGMGLLVPRFQVVAAWGLIALLVAVFPANIYMYQHPELFPDVSPNALFWRLPIQFLLIAWAYVYTKPTR